MSQGQFTKEESQETIEAVIDVFAGLPKSKRMNYLGHLNDILLFIEVAKHAAPEETK